MERLRWIERTKELARDKVELEDEINRLKRNLTTTQSELQSVFEREAKLQQSTWLAVFFGYPSDSHLYHTGLSNTRIVCLNSENEVRLLEKRMAKADEFTLASNNVIEELRSKIKDLDSEIRSANAKFRTAK